jgi:crotonobetainyl-CoA:carnitine CoA-transferase CaiB-like acyl-CoA transferase
MAGPLDGVRILDLTSVILGPYATQLLGDMGADVVKVESPEGDSNRYVSPGRHRGMSGTAVNLHRNKRSIVLDLKQDAGRAALLKLAEGADALIHNMLPATMARLGLAYDDVAAVRPDIVYCACTGYGPGGPWSGRPAYDDLIQGASGMAALMRRMHGEPCFFPAVLCDKLVGVAAVNAVTAALFHRERSGEGQYVEVPMLETVVSFNMAEHAGDWLFEPPLAPFGYGRVLSPNRRPCPTADGHVCILAYTDRQWRTLFGLIGRPELAEDTRFADLAARTRNIDALYGLVCDATPARPTDEWLALCVDAGIPATRVADLGDAREDPHLTATGFLAERRHPSEGRYIAVGVVPHFARTPGGIRREAPLLGEHGAELLREAGYGDGEIDALRAAGVTL